MTPCLAFVALATSLASGSPPQQWRDTNGASITPLVQKKGHIEVLLFALTDCPIAISYAPEMHRIIDKYGKKGVAFHVVYVDSDITTEKAMKHLREYAYQCSAVLDPQHTLAKLAGATTSPEAVVIGPSGAISYRGRIDDRAVDFGKARPAPTRRDLRLTLDALLAGKTAPVSHTRCVGCVISMSKSTK